MKKWHFFYNDFSAQSFTLYLGSNTLNPDAGALTITSTSYIQHEQYNDNTLENDVALIELPTPVTLNGRFIKINQYFSFFYIFF